MAKKIFGLEWIFENFEDHPTFFSKRMFGGLAAYVHGKLVMMLAEDPGNKEYRGQTYDFEIWNGVLIPTDRKHHEDLKQQFPNLTQHPILGKWLYLTMQDPSFETTALALSELIEKNDPRIGIIPSSKKRNSKKKKTKKKVRKKNPSKKLKTKKKK